MRIARRYLAHHLTVAAEVTVSEECNRPECAMCEALEGKTSAPRPPSPPKVPRNMTTAERLRWVEAQKKRGRL